MVSSSNENMLNRDPLASFIIQHIGSSRDPFHGWGLNCRTSQFMHDLLNNAGFKDIQLSDDANYPEKNVLAKKGLLFSVDTLPSEALGYSWVTRPLVLPSDEEMQTGFNHIAVAVKG